MAANTSFCFQDAMDRIWFHRNILFSAATGLNISTTEKIKASSETQNSLSQPSSEPAPKCSSQKPRFKQKRPTRLKVVVDQPCYRFHEQPTSTIRSCPSLSSTLKHKICNEGRIMKRLGSHKSVAELEKYELKGFMDLGFVFRKEELSVEIVNMIPGLQRLGEEGREEDEGLERPYLSEAWMSTNGGDLAPVRFPLLPKRRTPYGADMKGQLRSWAREVASVIHHNFVDKL